MPSSNLSASLRRTPLARAWIPVVRLLFLLALSLMSVVSLPASSIPIATRYAPRHTPTVTGRLPVFGMATIARANLSPMLQILRYNSRHLRCHHASLLRSSRRSDDRFEDDNLNQQQPQQKHQPALKLPQPDDPEMASSKSIANPIMRAYQDAVQKYRRPPPRVEDVNVLLYDIVLILNLSVSISFWVIHRMEFSWIGTAFNEGCLLSILWIVSGLWTGAFLNSAVDGHFGSLSEEGGHLAAARLAFHTFLNAINLRLVVALCMAIVQHRPVGIAAGEQLMPLELAFGLGLMIFWRAIHSSIVPRF